MSAVTDRPGAAESAMYTRGEVAYLLGVTRDDAVVADAVPRSCMSFSGNESSAAVLANDEVAVSTLVRWDEVHAARRRIIARRLLEDGVDRREILLELVVVRLRSWGLAESAIGDTVGIDRLAARRRFTRVLDQVLDELGGERGRDAVLLERPPDACLKCGQRPRVRSARKVRVVRDGQRSTEWRERQTSLCRSCLAAAPARPQGEVLGSPRDLRERVGWD